MREAVRLLRPHQWTKNLLCFAGVAFSGRFLENVTGTLAINWPILGRAAATFGVFCAASSADHRETVVDVALVELERPDVALLLAGEDRALLERVARVLDERGGHPVATEARARAERALLGQAKQPDASAATLAEAAQLLLRRGDRPGAIQFLRRATTIEYAALDWRLDLARALAAEGHVDQAIDEARNVLRQAPAHAVAKKLLDEWQRSAPRPATQRAPATAPATPAGFKLD